MSLVQNDICQDYTEDSVWFNGERRTVCSYWNLDDPGLCRHEGHNTCLVYLDRRGIKDPWLINFMDEMGCVLVKENI